MDFTAEILPCLDNNELCILKLKQLGLLSRDIKCIQCNRDLLWTKHKKAEDGFARKYQNTKCKNHKYTVSVRNRSFFANSNLSLAKMGSFNLLVIYSNIESAGSCADRCQQTINYKCLRMPSGNLWQISAKKPYSSWWSRIYCPKRRKQFFVQTKNIIEKECPSTQFGFLAS